MTDKQREVMGYLAASQTLVLSRTHWCGSDYWRLYQPGQGVYGPAYDRDEIRAMLDAGWLRAVYTTDDLFTYFRLSDKGECEMQERGIKAYSDLTEGWIVKPERKRK